MNATLLVMIVIGAIVAFPKFTTLIVDTGALCNAFVVIIICITVIQARKRNPGKSAFKAPGGSVVPIITMIVIVICYIPGIIKGGGPLWLSTAVYYAIGLAIYFISKAVRKPDETLPPASAEE